MKLTTDKHEASAIRPLCDSRATCFHTLRFVQIMLHKEINKSSPSTACALQIKPVLGMSECFDWGKSGVANYAVERCNLLEANLERSSLMSGIIFISFYGYCRLRELFGRNSREIWQYGFSTRRRWHTTARRKVPTENVVHIGIHLTFSVGLITTCQ